MLSKIQLQQIKCTIYPCWRSIQTECICEVLHMYKSIWNTLVSQNCRPFQVRGLLLVLVFFMKMHKMPIWSFLSLIFHVVSPDMIISYHISIWGFRKIGVLQNLDRFSPESHGLEGSRTLGKPHELYINQTWGGFHKWGYLKIDGLPGKILI